MSLTKREEIAARALQGLLANSDWAYDCTEFADMAVKEADLLIAALGNAPADSDYSPVFTHKAQQHHGDAHPSIPTLVYFNADQGACGAYGGVSGYVTQPVFDALCKFLNVGGTP